MSTDVVPTFPLRGRMWDISHALFDLAGGPSVGASVEERLAHLEDERTVRDGQLRYFDALDRGDLDAIMSFFHDECVQIGARGTFVGKDAIRGDYQHVLAGSKVRVHYTTNVAVRLLRERSEAWVSARNYAVLVRGDGRIIAVAGNTAERLIRAGDTWLFIERRATAVVAHSLTREEFNLGGASPSATSPETSYDLVGPDAVM